MSLLLLATSARLAVLVLANHKEIETHFDHHFMIADPILDLDGKILIFIIISISNIVRINFCRNLR